MRSADILRARLAAKPEFRVVPGATTIYCPVCARVLVQGSAGQRHGVAPEPCPACRGGTAA